MRHFIGVRLSAFEMRNKLLLPVFEHVTAFCARVCSLLLMPERASKIIRTGQMETIEARTGQFL